MNLKKSIKRAKGNKKYLFIFRGVGVHFTKLLGFFSEYVWPITTKITPFRISLNSVMSKTNVFGRRHPALILGGVD